MARVLDDSGLDDLRESRIESWLQNEDELERQSKYGSEQEQQRLIDSVRDFLFACLDFRATQADHRLPDLLGLIGLLRKREPEFVLPDLPRLLTCLRSGGLDEILDVTSEIFKAHCIKETELNFPENQSSSPRRVSSSSIRGRDQTAKRVEAALQQELLGLQHYDVEPLIEGIYGTNPEWAEKLKQFAAGAKARAIVESAPKIMSEAELRAVINKLQEEAKIAGLPLQREWRSTTKSNEVLSHSGDRHQLDFFLYGDRDAANGNLTMDRVYAVGEHTTRDAEAEKLLQGARYLRSIMSNDRSRILGHYWIYFRGSVRWIFVDRAKLLMSSKIDLRKGGENVGTFIRVMIGDLLVEDFEFGVTTNIIETDPSNGRKFVTADMSGGRSQKWYLANDGRHLPCSRNALNGRATTIFEARSEECPDKKFIVKLSWQEEPAKHNEIRNLQHANERKAGGVPTLVGWREMAHTGRHFIDLLTKYPLDGVRERCLMCLVTEPMGLSITDACDHTSPRDIIRVTHRITEHAIQLSQPAIGLLHRDIAASNIIVFKKNGIVDDAGLIDLEISALVDETIGGTKRTGMTVITGHRKYMSTAVLQNCLNPDEHFVHRLRDDLESIFKVLLVYCIGDSHKSVSIWAYSDLETASWTQMGLLGTTRGFRSLLKDVPEKFEDVKGILEDLRTLLFPLEEAEAEAEAGNLQTLLYEPFLAVLWEADQKFSSISDSSLVSK